MTGFPIAWLDLREPADIKARDKSLATQALQWLQKNYANQGHLLVDLGAGTGSSLRAFAALGAVNLVWRLVDNDGDLLDEALRRHGRHWIIEDYEADLNIINELPLGGSQLVTASALFDLASREFIDALANRLTPQKSALYAALNYNGTTEWSPAHPLDEIVLHAFNNDQLRNKGFGPALGPAATDYLEEVFAAAGYTVFTADSPWRLGPADHALVGELINGIANAIKESIEQSELAAWRDFRLAHVHDGTCSVGHLDFLALPVAR